MKIIGTGAEAVLRKKGDVLIKERIKKGYRLSEIDAVLRKERTKREARLMNEARRNQVNAPAVFSKNPEKMTIEMEFIEGPVLRDKLNYLSEKDRKKICTQIGTFLAKLHNAGIIHGDLTTSNIILKDNSTEQVYFIDFGLSFSSQKTEDKAVDLHLIKRAFVSKHNKIWKTCFKHISTAYRKENRNTEAILSRMEKIEKRGRYSK